MKFLVLGATGTVGSQVTRELLGRGAKVRALTRDPGKAAGLGPDVEVVKGDLIDPAALKGLFEGVDGAFIVNTVSPSESQEGLMAVSAAMTQKLKRVVYLSVQHADRAAHLPHFGAKVGIEHAVKHSGIPYTILRPSNFFQNDYWLKDVMLQRGIYPQPIGDKGVSRVDVRDIAEAAAIALINTGHDNKTYDVVGRRGMTGAETAKIWASALGRDVKYAGNDLTAWEKANETFLPPYLVYDFSLMYRHFQEHGLLATSAEVAAITKVLGHSPRSFEDFAAETAKSWSADATAR
jgi:uncharacterized protein YbjT (DUF2867 family)